MERYRKNSLIRTKICEQCGEKIFMRSECKKYCKKCLKNHLEQWYIQEKETIKEKSRLYRKKNKIKIQTRNKINWKKNRENSTTYCICGKRICPNSVMCRECHMEYLREKMRKNNPVKSDSVRKKISNTLKRKYQSNEILSHLVGKNKENSEIFRKVSERMKNGGGLKARISNCSKPNNLEKNFIKIMEKKGWGFEYVGDGKEWIKGEKHCFNPDFINKQKWLIIELFGKYWHKNTLKVDKERLISYSKQGYKTLVIWDYELQGKNKLREEDLIIKINNFIGG